jgi:hypothetical protein
VVRLAPLAMVLAAACDTGFEAQSIVVDLRVIAMRTEPAEVVVDVDPDDLASVDLPPVTVTALVVDPDGPRELTFSMSACAETFSLRCDHPDVDYALPMTEGRTTGGAPSGVLEANVALLRAALEEDAFRGLGGIPVLVSMILRAPDGTERYAAKRVMFAPRVPAARTANTNPVIARLLARGSPFDDGAPLAVRAGEQIELEPVEDGGARETYVTPTLDGDERVIIENLRYSWLATAGSFTDEFTGGARDLFGNEPPLRTRWRAPETPGEVKLWVVQRDERGGTSWIERRLVVE